jgi:hypothetical protein
MMEKGFKQPRDRCTWGGDGDGDSDGGGDGDGYDRDRIQADSRQQTAEGRQQIVYHACVGVEALALYAVRLPRAPLVVVPT